MDRPGWRSLVLFLGVTLSGAAIAWFVTWGATVAATEDRTFWIGVSYLAVAAFVTGLGLVAVGELGLPTVQPLRTRRLVRRAWARVRHRRSEDALPEPPERPVPHPITPHPWIDDDGQLVLTFKMSDSTPDRRSLGPIGGCKVVHNGVEWEAKAVPQYPAQWMLRAFYPRHFPGAPPVEPGDYEILWLTPLFSRKSMEVVEWRTDRSVTVRVVRAVSGELVVDLHGDRLRRPADPPADLGALRMILQQGRELLGRTEGPTNALAMKLPAAGSATADEIKYWDVAILLALGSLLGGEMLKRYEAYEYDSAVQETVGLLPNESVLQGSLRRKLVALRQVIEDLGG